ncbi:MAG: peptide chain release factor N(5)-glutamine methyltransferase [bacterium]|nr:peptide chain release factor N(5)-glutamine methyltransferase [bacterium]
MIINQILEEAIKKLSNKKILSAHLDAEILLSHIIKKPREYLLAHPEKKLTQKQVSSFKFQVSRRLKGEPVAYITGHKEFYGLDFFVDKNVLIPRQETELMVDEIMEQGTRNKEQGTIIDIGTGSGCIIITLAKNLNSKFKIQNSKFFATDISKPVLAIARKNAKLHNVHKDIKFFQGDLLKPIINNFSKFPGRAPRSGAGKIQNSKLIITANLPYLTPAQIKNSPSIKYEPKLALSAGADGLKYYRKLFKQIKNVSCSMFRVPCFVLCEIDPSQTTKIKQLINKELLSSQIQIKKDLRGLNRMVICSINLRQD